MKILKLTAMFGIIFCSISASIGFLNYTGYCSSQNRYLSDSEKITIAVENINKTPGKVFDLRNKSDQVEFPLETYIPYKTTKEFLRKNINCCIVTDEADTDIIPSVPFWSKVTGLHTENVKVVYKAKYKNSRDQIIWKNEAQARKINNCGEIK